MLDKYLPQQGLSESEFYGNLVYKFRKIYACNDFSTQFRKNHSSIYKDCVQHKCNTTDCMHGSFNPVTINNFASLFGCTPAGRASLHDGSSLRTFKPVNWCLMLWLLSGPPEFSCWFFFCFSISVIICCRVLIVVSSLYSLDFYVLGDVALMS